jgi:hypothetical protein
MDTLPSEELEIRLARLDELLAAMAAGQFQRTTFQPWEIEVLLDIQACGAGEPDRSELLRRYQKAAHRWFYRGGRTLLLLSGYMAKRHRRPPVSAAFAPGGAAGRSSR